MMRRPIPTLKFIIVSLSVLGCLSMIAAWSPGRNSTRALRACGLPSFQPSIPKGIPAVLWQGLIPADNPVTAGKVALGQALYFEKRLSAEGTVSCATCHDPATAFTDRHPIAIGVRGKMGTRNAPTVLNAMFNPHQFWDGRARSLEEQAKQPLINPAEMGMENFEAVVRVVASIPEYPPRFRQVFGSQGITIDTIVKAIAAFERTRLSGNSPFDRFMAGDTQALTQTQKRGWQLFEGKAHCITCHTFKTSSPFFTDFKFHNTGVAVKDRNFDQLARRIRELGTTVAESDLTRNLLAHTEGLGELGRYLVTKQPEDIGAFKTPTLRDIELTAPYMHNGSDRTLLDVVRFYNRGGEANPYLDEKMQPLELTDAEMNELVEFLRALTSPEVMRQVHHTRPQTRLPVQVLSTRIIH